KTRSGWKSVVSYRRRLSSLSRATFPIAYTSTAVIGKYYRIAALTPGHPDLGAVAYGYWHFRIIR
ncbi:MAG: hypothetical protein QOG02_1873, partial [Gaiellales bacterium]|nr:hypothetical protein [Gaiellales bacterium]